MKYFIEGFRFFIILISMLLINVFFVKVALWMLAHYSLKTIGYGIATTTLILIILEIMYPSNIKG